MADKHFDDQSTKRISAVVRAVEATGISNIPAIQKHPAEGEFLWFVLVEDFDSNKEANAEPRNWTASANSGAGEYQPDPAVRYIVRDTTGQSGASEGSWVLCRPVGSENGTVWEPVVVTTGFDRVSGNLTALTTGSSFSIDNVKPISGTSPLMDPDSTTETLAVSNVFSWTADDNALCHAEYNVTAQAWQAYQVACPA